MASFCGEQEGQRDAAVSYMTQAVQVHFASFNYLVSPEQPLSSWLSFVLPAATASSWCELVSLADHDSIPAA